MSKFNIGFVSNSEVFSFPNPVNEIAARLVAGMVFILSVAVVFTGNLWLLIFLTYGFVARVLSGPTLSPMGLIATRILAPAIGTVKLVPGPPKRFAQAVGVVFSVAALLAYFVLDSIMVTKILIGVLVLCSGLESFIGFCVGCFVFNYLIRFGLIPQSICEQCVIAQPDSN